MVEVQQKHLGIISLHLLLLIQFHRALHTPLANKLRHPLYNSSYLTTFDERAFNSRTRLPGRYKKSTSKTVRATITPSLRPPRPIVLQYGAAHTTISDPTIIRIIHCSAGVCRRYRSLLPLSPLPLVSEVVRRQESITTGSCQNTKQDDTDIPVHTAAGIRRLPSSAHNSKRTAEICFVHKRYEFVPRKLAKTKGTRGAHRRTPAGRKAQARLG